MTCGYCGYEIEERHAHHGCTSCPFKKKGCRMVRCPRCGYENPEVPAILRRLLGGTADGRGPEANEPPRPGGSEGKVTPFRRFNGYVAKSLRARSTGRLVRPKSEETS